MYAIFRIILNGIGTARYVMSEEEASKASRKSFCRAFHHVFVEPFGDYKKSSSLPYGKVLSDKQLL